MSATQHEQDITASDYKPGVLRHVVLFRYRDGITDEERDEVRRRFCALAGSLREGRRYITSIEWGEQMSPEGLDAGFQDAFILTFASEGDRNFYVGDPVISSPNLRDAEHHRFKLFVGPFLATHAPGALVFDFVSRDC